jgi:hypothetical protein
MIFATFLAAKKLRKKLPPGDKVLRKYKTWLVFNCETITAKRFEICDIPLRGTANF